ncbi:MAG: hypothetical protein FWE28_09080 [Oscillospiraceae bacterium]|nr:hypothetical protein [Oscillospiraceae bacterium]
MEWFNIIVIPIVIPIFLMVCTLLVQMKIHKRSMKLQKEQFQKSLDTTIANHNKLTEMSEEQNRIAIMPYFQLADELPIEPRKPENKFLDFLLTIKNVGNGIATEVCVIHNEHKLAIGRFVHVSDGVHNGIRVKQFYRYALPPINSIIQKNDKAGFSFALRIKGGGTRKYRLLKRNKCCKQFR